MNDKNLRSQVEELFDEEEILNTSAVVTAEEEANVFNFASDLLD